MVQVHELTRRGEGGVLPRRPVRRSFSEGGYVLLGILILVVIMGIFMGLAAPVWQHEMQREREEELLWRGRQYVRAIELYQQKFPGAFPANIDILVEQKFLRKAYPDPVAPDGEWKLLRQLSPEIRRMMNPAARGEGAGQAGRRGQRPEQEETEEQSPFSAPSRSPSRSRLGPGGDEQGLGGIVGVVSKSEDETIRVIDGKNHYNEWLFVYMQQTQGTQRPGIPGQRQPGLGPGGQPPGLGGRQPGLGGQGPGIGRPKGMQRGQQGRQPQKK